MASVNTRNAEESNAIVRYADHALWANPENEKQYQVKLWRVTQDVGAVNYFGYMGKTRPTPQQSKFYHIYHVGGTHPGIWNLANHFKGANPFNMWVNASIVAKRRGVQLDFYNNLGRQFPRTKTWLMFTHDGLVLVAFEKLSVFPLGVDDHMQFRCYSTDLPITKSTDALADRGNPFVFESMTYANTTEYATFVARFGVLKLRPGLTLAFHNGFVVRGFPAAADLNTGDVVEIWHDPTVKRVLYYDYAGLQDYYSAMDQQRKFILHPPKDPNGDFTLRYFDDCDYYFIGGDGKGVYYHRNVESAVRQLTHVDTAVSVSQLKGHQLATDSLTDLSTAQIMVIERDTEWKHEWPWDAQRIKYLYRLDDDGIMRAFTGERSTLPEWSAPVLESGPVMSYIRTLYGNVKTEAVHQALGYNAETLAVSATPVKVDYEPGTSGLKIPPTYQLSSTVWEYNAAGKLLSWYWITQQTNLLPRSAECTHVEFTLGKPATDLHYDVVGDDIRLPAGVGIRVYVQSYSVVSGQLVGNMRDVTGGDFYHLDDGVLVWDRLDKINQRGIIVYDDVFLCRDLTLDHLDHSLCFSLDDLYTNVIGNLPINFAQIDVFLNGSPLMDKVDWTFLDRRINIHNREFIVDGAQQITVRCFGQHSDMTQPKFELELGFVEGGVIGNQKRYNVRDDRATRVVVGGKLLLLEDLKSAELNTPDDYDNPLNGLPYMVKHTYTPVVGVKAFDHHYGYAESRALDKRVTDYLTLYCPKPRITVDYNMGEKYMLYSPFMSVIANAIVNGVLNVPALGNNAVYADKTVKDLVRDYEWWLPFDPIIQKFDLRYFGILPYVNVGRLAVTSDEFTFLKQVNALYLRSVLSIEGYFEVSQHV